MKIIAGYDISYSKTKPNYGIACLSIFDENANHLKDYTTAVVATSEYKPGSLYLREIVGLEELLPKVKEKIDILVIDGNGKLHPTQNGAACRYYERFGIRTIGIAKNLLCGKFQAVGNEKGSYSFVYLDGVSSPIGCAFRSATGVQPIFISSGCDLTIEESVQYILKFCTGFRIPEITRRADIFSRAILLQETNPK